MSSRRTRSGATLGSSEPRRLRKTPFRKQHTVKLSEEADTSHCSEIDTANGSSSAKNKSETHSAEPEDEQGLQKSRSKRIQLTCSNIWEQLVKNEGDLLGSSDIKRTLPDGSESVNGVTSTSPSTEKAAQFDTGAPKKNRKPEILVSLLEGETAYPISHHKGSTGLRSDSGSKPQENLDNMKNSREKSLLSAASSSCRKGENSDGYSGTSVCFFRNCECHRSDSLTDFSKMSDVPGEPFFVSLSKDENKELNMVKTSSGTVRVGCSLRRVVSHGHPYTETYRKSSLFSANEKPWKMRFLSQTSSAEQKSGNYSELGLYSSEKGASTAGPDADSDQRCLHNENTTKSNSVEVKSSAIENTDVEIIDDSSRNGPDKTSLRQKLKKDEFTSSGNSRSFTEIVQDKKRISDTFLRSGAGLKSSSAGGSHYKPLTACRSSQYPLMKEILTQQNFLPLTNTAAGLSGTVKHSDRHSEAGGQQHLKEANTFRSSSKSMTLLPSIPMPDSKMEIKNVKRSERIRCKTGMGPPCSIALHQSVISTMKPADKTPKVKSRLSSSRRSSRINFDRESQKKKNKKLYEATHSVKVLKSLKDIPKVKSAMSREVMDAIIQSIEETVSACGQEEKVLDNSDSASEDLSISCSGGCKSHSGISSSFTNMPRDSSVVDHWSDCALDHDYNLSASSAILPQALASKSASVINDRVTSGEDKKTPKIFTPKTTSRKSKKANQVVDKVRMLDVRSARPKIKSLTITTTIEDTPSSVTSIYATTENVGHKEAIQAYSDAASSGSSAGKRFRKQTRKAKEAFGDDDVFSDENWPVKKSKLKSRSSSTSSDFSSSSSSSSHRRLRRSCHVGGHVTDPVLAEHAFILWASENRSQMEQRYPDASSSEVDTILFSRWGEVTESVKAKFFFRAREAFSDDDRHMIRPCSVTDVEANTFGEFFNECDPVFTEFVGLPIEKQRDMLRKWLKFFQKTLPKKEYIDFIITFKRACNRDAARASSKSKRTRMRCLDPSHYKMLFDMIRLTKPRVLEVYKTRRDKEMSTVSDTYSITLLKLINNKPVPAMVPGCRSQALTEILQDLGVPESPESSLNVNAEAPAPCPSPSSCQNRSSSCVPEDKDELGNQVGGASCATDRRTNSGAVSKAPFTLEIKADVVSSETGFDESDFNLLNYDFALSLLSSLSEMSELPVLDQDMLDQIFLAPPSISAPFSQQRRAVNLYGRHLETVPENLLPVVSHPSACISPCLPRLFPSDPGSYPKINIHYTPGIVPSSSSVVHQLPVKHSNAFPHKYGARDIRDASQIRNAWCRKTSHIDMHTYSSTLENRIQSPAHFSGSHSKCFKVHAKVMPPQIKLNLQPLQLPVSSRTHQQIKLHPRVVPVTCGLQQRYPTIIYNPTNSAMLDKLGSDHVSQMTSQPLTSSLTSSSRMSSQSIRLSTPSPLITSLSPLRNVKYNHSSKMYSPHCQMVVPYKPRMQLTAGSASHRRTTHTIPISTTHKTSSNRCQSGLQQIKVCLSAQTLKIPIAKLREPRKTSYIKGKVKKNFSLQSSALEPYTNLPCSQPCQYNMRTNPPTSVLAKVLSFPANDDMEHLKMAPSADGLQNNSVSNSKLVNSTFIGTMRPVSMQSISSSLKSSTQLQVVSVVSSPSNTLEVKTTGSIQTAVIVSPVNASRSSHVTQPSCISTAGQSNSGHSVCSFASSVYCVSLANINGIAAQNTHMVCANTCTSLKSINHVKSQVDSGIKAVPETLSAASLFPESARASGTLSELRVVSPQVLGFSESTRESANDDSIYGLTEQNVDSRPFSEGCSEVIKDLNEKEETSSNHAVPEESLRLDDKCLGSSKVVESFTHGYNQGKREEEHAVTKSASTVSCNSLSVSNHILNQDLEAVGQTLMLSKAKTRPCVTDSDEGKAFTSMDYAVQDMPHNCVSGLHHESKILVNSQNCEQTSVTDHLSQLLVRHICPETQDTPWQCKCTPCAAGRDRGCQSVKMHDSFIYTEDLHDVGSDTTRSPDSAAKNCGKWNGNESRTKNRNSREEDMTVSEVLACDDNSAKDVNSACSTPFCNSTITTKNKSVSLTDGADSSISEELVQSNSDTDYELCDTNMERDISVEHSSVLAANREHFEHEYSMGNLGSSRCMMKLSGSGSASLTSPCASASSGLHILAETATCTRSLLCGRGVVKLSGQSKEIHDENRMLNKHDCVETSAVDSGQAVKKMTMCAVVVPPDSGCILVESLGSRDKNSGHIQKTNFDLSGKSSTVPALPASVNAGQTSHHPTPVPAMLHQVQNIPFTSRTTVMGCSPTHINMTSNDDKDSQVSSATAHPPGISRKHAHYIHEYMPT